MTMVNKISRIVVILLVGSLGILLPISSFAQNIFKTVYIGEIEQVQDEFKNKENRYTLYQVKGEIFIPLSTLEKIGFEINEQNNVTYIEAGTTQKVDEGQTIIRGSAYMAQYPVYCGDIRSYALVVENERLIPIEILNGMGKLKYIQGSYWLKEDYDATLKLVKMTEEGVENQSDHITQLKVVHLYWNGKAYEKIEESLWLEPGEQKKWIPNQKSDLLYITTRIQGVNEWCTPQDYQRNNMVLKQDILKQYSEAVYLEELNHIFPVCKIEGKMRYSIGTLKEGELVEIWRSEKHYYLSIKDQDGNKYQVPFQSVQILGEKGVRMGKATKEKIEDFATLSHIKSPTPYLIWTDLYRQRTYVLKENQGRWKLEKSFVCSTGKLNNPTPTGLYEVQYMIPYIGVQKGYRCKYAMVFFRDYMYHSILFDRTGNYIKSGQYELGSKASHGCVRLSEKDSHWLYNHIPVKTTVWIR